MFREPQIEEPWCKLIKKPMKRSLHTVKLWNQIWMHFNHTHRNGLQNSTNVIPANISTVSLVYSHSASTFRPNWTSIKIKIKISRWHATLMKCNTRHSMIHTWIHCVGLTIVLLTAKVEVLPLNLLSPAVDSQLLRHQRKHIRLIVPWYNKQWFS